MNNYIDENLITRDIVDNPVIHLEKLIDNFLMNTKSLTEQNADKKELIRAFHIINAFANEYSLQEISFSNISVSASLKQFTHNANTRLSQILMADQKTMYAGIFKKIENKMSDEEYEHIQNLINDLKIKIKSATEYDKDLQRRLLEKINKLQAEIDKDISSLELAKGRLITFADTVSYVHNKALKPLKDTTIDIINAMRGIEAKSEGASMSNQIEYQEEIEDVEVIDESQLIE